MTAPTVEHPTRPHTAMAYRRRSRSGRTARTAGAGPAASAASGRGPSTTTSTCGACPAAAPPPRRADGDRTRDAPLVLGLHPHAHQRRARRPGRDCQGGTVTETLALTERPTVRLWVLDLAVYLMCAIEQTKEDR